MAEGKKYIEQPQEGGRILISEDVIASIAALAVREVEGVYGLSTTAAFDISTILGKKNLRNGIRVTMDGENVTISCNLIVKMGEAVMTVAKNVQESIANEVISMTGVHPADLRTMQTGVDLGVVGGDVVDAHAALALGVVEIAAQLVRFEVAQGFLAAQLHPGAGNSVVAPIHLHVPGTGLIGAAHAQAGQRGGLQRAADDKGLARLGIHTHPDDKIGIFFQKFVKVFHERFLLRCKPCLFCFSIPVWGGNVHHPKTKRRSARLKKGEASVILISRTLSTYGMRSRLSGFASGIDAFLLLTPDANAKGGMLHDAFRNFGSAHTACNCGIWHVRHRMEDLQQQKMTASVRNLRSFFC